MKRAALSVAIIFAALSPSTSRADEFEELPLLVPRPVVKQFTTTAWTPANPDVDTFARWPLPAGKHPALAPAYPVANAFARPGTSWLSLCDRGAQLRLGAQKELTEYLHAWCDIARREPDAALARLAPLLQSPRPGLRDAIRIDIASILIDHGPADLAIRALTRARISSIDVYDTIAAAYAEIGRTEDADKINDLAISVSDRRDRTSRCRRLARGYVLAAADVETQRLTEMFDASCSQMAKEVKCAKRQDCEPYVATLDVPPDLLWDYKYWPTTASRGWDKRARELLRHRGIRGADALIVTALEAAITARRCSDPIVRELRSEALRYAGQKLHDRSHDKRLDVIVRPFTLCRSD